MVIPLPAMGPPLMGPPPAELWPRFRIMKYCVVGMIGSTFARILLAFMLSASVSQVLVASLNIILNAIVGIFLLKDDPLLGRTYEFLATTCCQMCAQQCGGGMNCLLTFVICNAITVLFDVLLNNVIGGLIHDIGVIFDPNQWTSGIYGFLLGVNVLAIIVAFMAQTVGAVQGFLAYRQARDFGTTATPGEWSGGGGGGGGPYFAGGRGSRAGYPAAREDAPARESQPSANFQPFSGGGNRLGGS